MTRYQKWWRLKGFSMAANANTGSRCQHSCQMKQNAVWALKHCICMSQYATTCSSHHICMQHPTLSIPHYQVHVSYFTLQNEVQWAKHSADELMIKCTTVVALSDKETIHPRVQKRNSSISSLQVSKTKATS